jgi:hypothetical protein
MVELHGLSPALFAQSWIQVERTELLKEARNCLLDRSPQLDIFLKPDNWPDR